jgi:saccharopepsin
MVEDGVVENAIFGVWMGDSKKGEEGEIMFGGIDSTKFTGDITYAPVVRKGYWEVELGSTMLIGDKKIAISSKTGAVSSTKV